MNDRVDGERGRKNCEGGTWEIQRGRPRRLGVKIITRTDAQILKKIKLPPRLDLRTGRTPYVAGAPLVGLQHIHRGDLTRAVEAASTPGANSPTAGRRGRRGGRGNGRIVTAPARWEGWWSRRFVYWNGECEFEGTRDLATEWEVDHREGGEAFDRFHR